MKQKLLKYIDEKFPNFNHDIHLRFELGEHFANGTDERINQVISRATALLEDTFSQDDYIYIYIKDWEHSYPQQLFGTTPNYLYELLSNHKIHEEIMYEYDEDFDESGEVIQVLKDYKVGIIYSKLNLIPYKSILQGIAHHEQGREPSIGQTIYFINMDKNIIFHMYDDRGCLIFSDTPDKLRVLYDKYNKWIVESWRESIDNLFRKA